MHSFYLAVVTYQSYFGSCVQTDASCDSTGGVFTGYGDLGRLVDEASGSGELSSAKRTLYKSEIYKNDNYIGKSL